MEQAFWVQSPGTGQLREEGLPTPGADDGLVRTLYSGGSRGTETAAWRAFELCARPTDQARTGSALPLTAKGASSLASNCVCERCSTSGVP